VYLAPFYSRLQVWDGPLPYGPSIYSVFWWRASVPTASMLDRALPEGVLENGGTASGYLYFQKVRTREGEVQERTGAGQPAHQPALIDIPFRRVERRPPRGFTLHRANGRDVQHQT
jgi:hypothetical protein